MDIDSSLEEDKSSLLEFHEYCMEGDYGHVITSMSNGADINLINEAGNSPIMSAIRYQNQDIVKLLAANRPEFNLENNQYETPLMLAAAKRLGDDCYHNFINKGADVNFENSEGKTAAMKMSEVSYFHKAVYLHRFLEIMIERGVKIWPSVTNNEILKGYLKAGEIADLLLKGEMNRVPVYEPENYDILIHTRILHMILDKYDHFESASDQIKALLSDAVVYLSDKHLLEYKLLDRGYNSEYYSTIIQKAKEHIMRS